jgi:hypothetical protein
MKSKMLIADWMINNMEKEDVVECIKRGSLSPDEIKTAEETIRSAPESSEQVAAEIAAAMPPTEVKKMLIRITKEDLIEDLKKNYPGDRKQGIIELCRRAGKKLEIRQTKRYGPQLFDSNNDQVNEDIALNECAAFEAERIRQRLLNRWTNVMRRAAIVQKKGKIPAMSQEQPVQVRSRITPESIIVEINAISDPVARKQAIIALVAPFGFTTAPSKRATDGIMILDTYGDQVSDLIALEEGAALKAATMNSVSFGRRLRASKKQIMVRKKFKAAVKKCKGKRNFQKCVGKLLRNKKKTSFGKKRTVSGVRRKYTSEGGRKSPGESATKFAVGTVKKGLDGNMWIIKKASNGVKRWSKK